MAIQIIGNVGNQGFALPMVSAFPVNVNTQHILGWDPVNQALNYFQMTVDSLGNFTVPGDMAVGDDLTVAGDAAVTGALTVGGTAAFTSQITSGNSIVAGVGAQAAGLVPGATPQLSMAGTKVVETRKTGWGGPTGAATRTAFDTTTVTLPQLAERVKALIDDLTTHGLIGA